MSDWTKVILNEGGSGQVPALDVDGYRVPCYDEALIDTIIGEHQLAALAREAVDICRGTPRWRTYEEFGDMMRIWREKVDAQTTPGIRP